MNTELLPCPWCGGQPEYKEMFDGNGYFGCRNVECPMCPCLSMIEEKDAIAAWNARAGVEGQHPLITEDAYTGLIRQRNASQNERDRLAERVKALEEALTPSAGTKAAYMGEFKFKVYGYGDADFYVPWTAIKQIMASIRDRAAKQELNPVQP